MRNMNNIEHFKKIATDPRFKPVEIGQKFCGNLEALYTDFLQKIRFTLYRTCY